LIINTLIFDKTVPKAGLLSPLTFSYLNKSGKKSGKKIQFSPVFLPYPWRRVARDYKTRRQVVRPALAVQPECQPSPRSGRSGRSA
jgi:hypothetical protein